MDTDGGRRGHREVESHRSKVKSGDYRMDTHLSFELHGSGLATLACPGGIGGEANGRGERDECYVEMESA
jgi:hypothetical protein